MNLPIPLFLKMQEVKLIVADGDNYATIFIAPDPMSGKSGRYSVFCIMMKKGSMYCKGRELRLREAREESKKIVADLLKVSLGRLEVGRQIVNK